jgi:hypothetical protein
VSGASVSIPDAAIAARRLFGEFVRRLVDAAVR